MKKILFAILTISFTFLSAQSPWVNDKGKGYAHVKLSTTPRYSGFFGNDNGESVSLNGSIKQSGIQTYGELGIGHGFQISLSAPYRFFNSTIDNDTINRESGKVNGWGNIDLSLKKNFINKTVLLSGEIKVSTPNLNENDAIGIRTGFNTWSFSPVLSTGYGKTEYYLYAYSGVEFNSKSISNNFLFGTEFGFNFTEKFTLGGSLNIRESLFDKATIDEENYLETFSFVNNQSFAGVTLKANYQVTEIFGVNASAYVINIKGRNLAQAAPVALGIYAKW